MKSIEEKIWDLVSGLASPKEQEELVALIKTQSAYRKVYDEIKSLHSDLSSVALEEPSMAFERNVMREIETLPIPGRFPMVDQRIIRGIAGFFIVAILSLLVALFIQLDWTSSAVSFEMPELNWDTRLNKPLLYAFLFADVILGLLFLDKLIRNRLS